VTATKTNDDRAKAWERLFELKERGLPPTVELFRNDDDRFGKFSFERDGIFLDLSKNPITDEVLENLIDLARASELEDWRNRMVRGEKINTTENRAVLHWALRNADRGPIPVDGEDVSRAIGDILARMRAFTVSVRGGIWKGATGKPITDVVNIGIGGSDLGPAMATRALKPYHKNNMRFHFVSNPDAAAIHDVLDDANPASTLFIVASKSFATAETLLNAGAARAWLVAVLGERAVARHFVAISTNKAAARNFGIDPANMFPFWDWVGGRYSVWSAIGLSVALAIGMDGFEDFLGGAAAMDNHFLTRPMESNMPVLLGLVGVWNQTVLGCRGHAVLTYAERLSRFAAFLQQMDMESNGKGVTRDGNAPDHGSGGILFGESGTNAQHAFMQLLHQGTTPVSTDFIGVVEPEDGHPNPHHRMMLANCLAQGEVLMLGRKLAAVEADLRSRGFAKTVVERLAPHKVLPGGRPVTTILIDRLDAWHLGQLIALYEHKVFVQGILWGVNSFDQWGVELGKTLARTIEAELGNGVPSAGHDPSTTALIERVLKIGGHGS